VDRTDGVKVKGSAHLSAGRSRRREVGPERT
jgi:hypothetical protein